MEEKILHEYFLADLDAYKDFSQNEYQPRPGHYKDVDENKNRDKFQTKA